MKREMNYISIDSIVDYWQRYWFSRTQEISSGENYKALARSPRVLLNNILSELKYNGFKNSDNRKLFRDELEAWRKEPVFKMLFDKECGHIISIWGSKPLTIASICNSIISKMDEGIYFRDIITKLIACLRTPDDFSYDNKKRIHQYCDILIVELLSKGYDIDDIHNAIIHPSVYMASGNSVIMAPDELCGYKRCEYNSDEEYYDALTDYFLKLPVEDKVNLLNLHYNKTEHEAIVIIRLCGIKGEIDAFIDDINIYSVNKRRYITDITEQQNIETSDANCVLINAAVPVKHKGGISSKKYAINKLKNILALLEIRLDTNQPISFSSENITIVENGRIICIFDLTLPMPKVDEDKLKKLSYNEISNYIVDVDNLSRRLTTAKSFSVSDFIRISNAAQWIQKSKSTDIISDRLLYSWIAIESLIKMDRDYEQELTDKNSNILSLAQKIIIPIIIHNKFYNYSRVVYHLLYWNFNYGSNRYGISTSLKEELYKNETEKGIPRSNIFKCIDKLISEVVEESFRTELQAFNEFYSRDCSGIQDFKKTISSELTLIYIHRNMIMHNAVYSEYQLKYYANRALFYASSLLNAIFTVSTTYQLTISDTIIKIVSDGNIFDKDMMHEIDRCYI